MKTTIRRTILAQREQLPVAVRAAHSATITERLLQLPAYLQSEAVLGYMNFGAEFASELWVERALADGKRLALPKEVEFALLPGVAFTRDGARLGYGGGYYDKLLASMAQRPALVAAAFALQIVEALPQEATDVKVEWVVTERESIACALQWGA